MLFQAVDAVRYHSPNMPMLLCLTKIDLRQVTLFSLSLSLSFSLCMCVFFFFSTFSHNVGGYISHHLTQRWGRKRPPSSSPSHHLSRGIYIYIETTSQQSLCFLMFLASASSSYIGPFLPSFLFIYLFIYLFLHLLGSVAGLPLWSLLLRWS